MLTRTVAPAERLVSMTAVKAHLRVEVADEDDLIDVLRTAAEEHLDGPEGILGRCILTQTWVQEFAAFDDPLRLDVWPVQSVVVKYDDADDVEQTLSSAVYTVGRDALGWHIALRSGQSWPVVGDTPRPVRVTVVAGFGAASAVPAPIKQAALLLVGHWYENRQAAAPKALATAPMAVEALLAPYRRCFV